MTNNNEEMNSPEFKEFMRNVESLSEKMTESMIVRLKELTTNESGMQLISAMLCSTFNVLAPMMAQMPPNIAFEAIDAMVLDLKLAVVKSFSERDDG